MQIAYDKVATGAVDGMMFDSGDECGCHATMIERERKARMRGFYLFSDA
jgi:hypothetical protein